MSVIAPNTTIVDCGVLFGDMHVIQAIQKQNITLIVRNIRGTKNKGTPISVYFASERTMLHLTQLKPNPGPLAISVVTHRCSILYPSWFSRIMHCTCVVGYKLNTITCTSHCSENASTTIPDRETKMASNWDGAGGSVPESGGSILWKIKKRDFPSCNVTPPDW